MIKRWEVLIPSENYGEFRELLYYTDLDDRGCNATHRHGVNVPMSWVICYPSDEFKMLAKLKFQISEMPAFGTEIDFSD